ncbi:hypothetical protein NUM3379_41210 [Kineococcus sp. NUM-3379]
MASPAAWRLVESGLFSLRQRGPRHVEIEGHQYVGRALIDQNCIVAISEKVTGSLRALLTEITGVDIRVEDESSRLAEFGIVSRFLLTEFVRASESYVASRREARYVYKPASSPVLAGSLNMAATLRLHALGRTNYFAFSRSQVLRDKPLDRIVLAALMLLDEEGATLGLDAGTIFRARVVAGALEEVRDEDFLMLGTIGHLKLAEEVEEEFDTPMLDKDLARLAAITLMQKGWDEQEQSDGATPRAWFLNLESLFERAVRSTLAAILPDDTVDRGQSSTRRLFTGGVDRSKVNPDIIVHGRTGVRLVADVKYKSLNSAVADHDYETVPRRRSKKAPRPDLYQVLMHAASLECNRALVVYAADSAEQMTIRFLGRSATGCDTWIAAIRPTYLREDLSKVIEALLIEW